MNLTRDEAFKLAGILLDPSTSQRGLGDQLFSALSGIAPDTPPDVSGLRFDGKEVEIAEPKRRLPKKGELYRSNHVIQACADHGTHVSDVALWILRIKEPLSVYGCDPKLVDLSQLRGPNGRAVEWVDFREPVIGELVPVAHTGIVIRWGVSHYAFDVPDKRRIIVREVEERCGVGWKAFGNKVACEPCLNTATHRAISTNGHNLTIFRVCEECARLGAAGKYSNTPSNQMLQGDPLWLIWPPLDTPRPLADLTDPKVLDAIRGKCEAYVSDDTKNAVVNAFMAMEAGK